MLRRPVQCLLDRDLIYKPASEIIIHFWLSCQVCELRPCDPRDMFCHHSSSFRLGRKFSYFFFYRSVNICRASLKVGAISRPLLYVLYCLSIIDIQQPTARQILDNGHNNSLGFTCFGIEKERARLVNTSSQKREFTDWLSYRVSSGSGTRISLDIEMFPWINQVLSVQCPGVRMTCRETHPLFYIWLGFSLLESSLVLLILNQPYGTRCKFTTRYDENDVKLGGENSWGKQLKSPFYW